MLPPIRLITVEAMVSPGDAHKSSKAALHPICPITPKNGRALGLRSNIATTLNARSALGHEVMRDAHRQQRHVHITALPHARGALSREGHARGAQATFS